MNTADSIDWQFDLGANVNSDNKAQPLKHDSAREVIQAGMQTEEIEMQPAMASRWMRSTFSTPNVTCESETQF
jgi:hypothetical protein